MTCEVPPAWLAAFPGTRFLPQYRLMIGHPHGVMDHTRMETMLHWLEAVEPQLGAFDRFWDFSEIKEVRLDCDEVMALAERRRDRYFGEEVKTVILAPTPVHYGLARMYEQFMEGVPIHVEVVGRISTAAARLGVPAEELVKEH